jgi:hypothetical protein
MVERGEKPDGAGGRPSPIRQRFQLGNFRCPLSGSIQRPVTAQRLTQGPLLRPVASDSTRASSPRPTHAVSATTLGHRRHSTSSRHQQRRRSFGPAYPGGRSATDMPVLSIWPSRSRRSSLSQAGPWTMTLPSLHNSRLRCMPWPCRGWALRIACLKSLQHHESASVRRDFAPIDADAPRRSIPSTVHSVGIPRHLDRARA